MKTLFDEIGGEEPLRRLVDRFYDLMDERPDCRPVRAMHPPDLTTSRDRLFWFLCGWTGGPQHYIERRGHPRLRARHLPFAIDDDARDQWMRCMDGALAEVVGDEDLRRRLSAALLHVASFMRNQGGAPHPGLPIR